ncbi:DUF3152 domain-containing protein [Streptomyces sp. NPDC058045]|uniref:DUF3152 domain-containing protein n=1 Tax=Streptomyces sp. NPDC058045 TaxID=3346311 RepID=UPI0036E5758E
MGRHSRREPADQDDSTRAASATPGRRRATPRPPNGPTGYGTSAPGPLNDPAGYGTSAPLTPNEPARHRTSAPEPGPAAHGTPGSGTPGSGTPGPGAPRSSTPVFGTAAFGTPGFGRPGAGGAPVSGPRADGPAGYGSSGRGAAPDPAGPGTPAQGTPAFRWPGPALPETGAGGDAGGAGVGAVVRGGHPEHREPGGGWGAVSGAEASAGPDAPSVPRHTPAGGTPRPVRRPGGPGAVGPVRSAAGPGAVAPPEGPRIPGPRREYLDAFDDEDVFAPRGSRFPVALQDPGAGRELEGWGEPDGRDGLDGDSEEGGPEAPTRSKGGRGFTFTGIAAAAVTTVLAIVVAGQVADGRSGSGGTRRDGSGDEASRQDQRPAPAAQVGYAQKMSRSYPLSPKLKGSGAFSAVPGRDRAPGKGRQLRYRVDVEKGLALDGKLFAQAVQKTLNDKRSWARDDRAFERISSGRPDFVITLASPGTTAVWCAKSGLDTTEDNVSCDSAATDRVLINAYRWAQGSKTYGPDQMHAYRQMLINHEVGHRLGFNHVNCTRNGALAPVMQQQTKFLSHNGITCKPNPWPFPNA